MITQTIYLTLGSKQYKIQLKYEPGDNPEHVWKTGNPPISFAEYLNIEKASLGKHMLLQQAAWYYWRKYPEEYWTELYDQ